MSPGGTGSFLTSFAPCDLKPANLGALTTPTGGVLPRIGGRAFICAESKLVEDAFDPFRYGIRSEGQA
jgi:hypothetical protein